MSRMTNPANSLCFPRKMRVVPTPQIPCVFSGKMRFAFNVIVNLSVMRPTAAGFRIFFQGKRASRKPFQIPCVFSMKARLAFKVIVNLYVMRSTAPTFLVFFQRKCASQESCRIRWVHFPCVFSGNPRLAFRSDCEFTCDAANCALIPNTSEGIPRGSQCHCKFSFVPKAGRKPNLDKGTL